VLILFMQPNGLPREDRGTWAAEVAASLEPLPGVIAVSLSRLAPSRDFARHWDWLLELTTPDTDAAQALLRSPFVRDLLLDFRLLGTKPRVVLTAGAGADADA